MGRIDQLHSFLRPRLGEGDHRQDHRDHDLDRQVVSVVEEPERIRHHRHVFRHRRLFRHDHNQVVAEVVVLEQRPRVPAEELEQQLLEVALVVYFLALELLELNHFGQNTFLLEESRPFF